MKKAAAAKMSALAATTAAVLCCCLLLVVGASAQQQQECAPAPPGYQLYPNSLPNIDAYMYATPPVADSITFCDYNPTICNAYNSTYIFFGDVLPAVKVDFETCLYVRSSFTAPRPPPSPPPPPTPPQLSECPPAPPGFEVRLNSLPNPAAFVFESSTIDTAAYCAAAPGSCTGYNSTHTFEGDVLPASAADFGTCLYISSAYVEYYNAPRAPPDPFTPPKPPTPPTPPVFSACPPAPTGYEVRLNEVPNTAALALDIDPGFDPRSFCALKSDDTVGVACRGYNRTHIFYGKVLPTVKVDFGTCLYVNSSYVQSRTNRPPPPPPPNSNVFTPLPGDLQPEVAHFDASTGVNETSGGVKSWVDAGSATTATNVLTFTGSCRLDKQDKQATAIAFDGSSCVAINSGDLPSSWDPSATAAFTAVWIGKFNEGNEGNQVFMTLSRTPSDFDQEFFWSTNERMIYSHSAGFAYYAQQGSEAEVVLPPSGRWTLEAFVRQPGAQSVSYYRYGSDGPFLESWQAASAPSQIAADNFAIGADPRDGDRFLDGKVSVVLLYNRALSEDSMMDLASFYAPRFKWSTPQPRMKPPSSPPTPTLPPAPWSTNTTKTFRCKPGIALWGTNLPRTPVKLSNRASTVNNTAECQRLCAENPGCKGYYYKTTTWCYLLGEVKGWGKKYSTAVQACKLK